MFTTWNGGQSENRNGVGCDVCEEKGKKIEVKIIRIVKEELIEVGC